MDWTWIVLIVLVLIVLYIIATYNTLIKAKNIVKNGLAQIDTQLKRRFDLIPNLVECVKMYMEHEKSTLEKIVELRNNFKDAATVESKETALKELNSSLKEIFVSVEAYPDLKASENFGKLQDALKGTEDKIAFARQFYNDSVTRYNNSILTFPNNVVAGMFNFKEERYFEIEEQEKENVKVSL